MTYVFLAKRIWSGEHLDKTMCYNTTLYIPSTNTLMLAIIVFLLFSFFILFSYNIFKLMND